MSKMMRDYADAVLRLMGVGDGYYTAADINRMALQFPPPDNWLHYMGWGLESVPILEVDKPFRTYMYESIIWPIEQGDLGFHPCLIEARHVEQPEAWGEWKQLQDWLELQQCEAYMQHGGQVIEVRGYNVTLCNIRWIVKAGYQFTA